MHKSSTICCFYLVSPFTISHVLVMYIYHVKSSMPSNAFKLFKEEVKINWIGKRKLSDINIMEVVDIMINMMNWVVQSCPKPIC